jgi:hypothetical protein
MVILAAEGGGNTARILQRNGYKTVVFALDEDVL